ncbi:MAG: HupE/UreJ family protein [Vicinamibacterales bacterium]
MRALVLGVVAALLLSVRPALAHPTPFTYLDIRVSQGHVEVDLVAHIIDVAHDLNVDPPERLLRANELKVHGANITTMLAARFRLQSDGALLQAGPWSDPEALPERQSIKMTGRFDLPDTPGVLRLDALMFPYDPMHQTFVNVYESDALALQAILDQSKTTVEFFSGSRQGVWAVVRRFVGSGMRHIAFGPEHLLFLAGVLLLGASLRQLAFIVSMFTVAQVITLTLATFNVLSPPGRIVEPAIALSLVYLGADNLMVRNGKDLRGWITFGFGAIHGFGFANVLRQMDLPRQALGWSIFSFSVGVQSAQLIIVMVAGLAFASLRARNQAFGGRLVYVGSIAVILGGAFWFIQRVFFPGAIV